MVKIQTLIKLSSLNSFGIIIIFNPYSYPQSQRNFPRAIDVMSYQRKEMNSIIMNSYMYKGITFKEKSLGAITTDNIYPITANNEIFFCKMFPLDHCTI